MALTRKRRRLLLVCLAMLSLGGATALVLTAFSDNLVFFYAPGDIAAKGLKPGQKIRLGGLVEPGSVAREPGSPTLSFDVGDGRETVHVTYTGVVPDLFREGQGVVVTGALRPDGRFDATELLAKHDEKYMPPEVADALKRSGRWKEDERRAGEPAGAAPDVARTGS